MDKRPKICFFLHTTIGVKDGDFYIKDLLNEYFIGLSEFAEITLVGTCQPKQFFHNSLITPKIYEKLLSIRENRNIIIKIKKIISNIRQSNLCFIFMPSWSSVLAGIFCFLMRKPFITYFGASWHDLEMAQERRSKLKAVLYKSMSNFLSCKSVFSLYTGDDILNSHKGHNRILTRPILKLSKDFFFKRVTYKNLTKASEIEILFVGALTKNKGINVLLNAIHRSNNLKLILHVIGDGAERNNLEKITELLGIGNQVTFHGFIDNGVELYNFYRRSDIFVLPSYSEGLPRVLYEAAGNGCAIITTPVNSISSLFKDGYNCLFITPGSVDSIINAINRLIAGEYLNSCLAENAYNTIRFLFDERAYEQHFRLMKQFVL